MLLLLPEVVMHTLMFAGCERVPVGVLQQGSVQLSSQALLRHLGKLMVLHCAGQQVVCPSQLLLELHPLAVLLR